jgi:hypothetical protein
VDFADLDQAQRFLTATNAFEEPADEMGKGKMLVLPSLLGLQTTDNQKAE